MGENSSLHLTLCLRWTKEKGKGIPKKGRDKKDGKRKRLQIEEGANTPKTEREREGYRGENAPS